MITTTLKNTFSNLVGEPGPLAAREAFTRFLGVSVLLVVGYLHLLDISHKISEGIWYMVLLFLALVISSVVLSVALVRADDSRIRFVWVAVAGLAAGAMFGYFVSRAIPLPGMADHQGDWLNRTGVLAGLAELALVALSAFALRDRVLRRELQRGGGRRRTSLAAPAMSVLGLFALQPAMAAAHGDEEMTAEEMAAAEMGHDPGAMDHGATSQGAATHDPLLGGTELGVIAMLALGFAAWAGASLRGRVETARGSRSRTRRTAHSARPLST